MTCSAWLDQSKGRKEFIKLTSDDSFLQNVFRLGGLGMKNDIAKIGTREDKDTWVISKATSFIKLGVGNDTYNSIIPQCSCQIMQVWP